MSTVSNRIGLQFLLNLFSSSFSLNNFFNGLPFQYTQFFTDSDRAKLLHSKLLQKSLISPLFQRDLFLTYIYLIMIQGGTRNWVKSEAWNLAYLRILNEDIWHKTKISWFLSLNVLCPLIITYVVVPFVACFYLKLRKVKKSYPEKGLD